MAGLPEELDGFLQGMQVFLGKYLKETRETNQKIIDLLERIAEGEVYG